MTAVLTLAALVALTTTVGLAHGSAWANLTRNCVFRSEGETHATRPVILPPKTIPAYKGNYEITFPHDICKNNDRLVGLSVTACDDGPIEVSIQHDVIVVDRGQPQHAATAFLQVFCSLGLTDNQPPPQSRSSVGGRSSVEGSNSVDGRSSGNVGDRSAIARCYGCRSSEQHNERSATASCLGCRSSAQDNMRSAVAGCLGCRSSGGTPDSPAQVRCPTCGK